MYQSSVRFGELVQQDSRTFHAQITLGEHSITDGIKSITVNGGSNSEDDFSIGSAVSQYVEITMELPDFRVEGHEFSLEIGMDVNGSLEYIPMGYFTAEKPDSNEEQITFTAYDRMMKMERPCFLELPDATDTVSVLNAISAITGVTVETSGLAAISIQKPVGYTCREVLSYIAQIYGGFAICNRSGKIEIRTYQDNGYTVPTNRYWGSFDHNDVEFLLEKLTCYTGKDEEGNDISISAGSGVREISFSNPFMTQSMMDDIWTSLQNYTYMPGRFKFLGDPRVDPWDVLTVEDRNGTPYKVPAMTLIQHYDGGLSTEVEAVGKSESEQSAGFQGPNAKQMDRYYAQLVVIDHMLSNKIDADVVEANYVKSTRFEGLQADFEETRTRYLEFEEATGNDLTLIHGNIQTLEGDFASYKTIVANEFAATTADITNLTGRFSTFEQTVTDELITAKGWMAEGSIGSAQISSVDANKIKSGTIDTAIVTIAGSDGRLQISDNTMQISDANRVRVQVGKDASGDYTLAVWDSSGKLIWDALGATENTIQRKIIRDKMVADDAAIQALKLDLQSFNTALTNQCVTISGTVVQVGNKTLNVALTEQSQLISEHGETLTDHATRISANEKGISLKVSTQEYESYKSTVNGEIASAKSRLSTAESSITALNGQIALKVEQTDIDTAVKKVDDKFANYSTTTQMNTAINQKADSITQSISATYATKSSLETANSNIVSLTSRVQKAESKLTKDGLTTIVGDYYTTENVVDSKINGIEIGGRNLAIETNQGTYRWGWMTQNSGTVTMEEVQENSIRCCKFTRTSTDVGGWSVIYYNIDNRSKYEAGKTYTVSFEVKASVNTSFNCDFKETDGTNPLVYSGMYVQPNTSANVWTKCVFVLTLKNPLPSTTGQVLYLWNMNSNAGVSYIFRNLMIEEGNKASAWTPAPEDVDSSISAVQTIAEQTATKFSWLVKSGTSSTDFTLTDRTATLVADAINLQGLVTFDGLSSSAKSSIIDSVQVGGRNLLRASTLQYTSLPSTANFITYIVNNLSSHVLTVDGMHYKANADNGAFNSSWGIRINIDDFGLSIGDMIAISYDCKGKFGSNNNGLVVMHATDNNSDFYAAVRRINGAPHPTEGYSNWKRITGTYNIESSLGSTKYLYIFFGGGTGSEVDVYVRNVKIEKGNKATDWSPASEDVDSSISAVDTALANLCYDSNKTYIKGGKIYTGTITAVQIASNAITTDKLAANSVTAAKIAAGTITATQIASSAITSDKIASSAITADKISSNAVTAAKIAAKAVTADKLSVTSLSAISANLGSVTAGSINIGSGKFVVTSAGVLTATGATITGNITATSGSFTGTVNANEGTIGNIKISGNKISYDSIDSSYGTLAKFEISKSQLSYGCMIVKGNSIQIGRDQRDQAFTDGNDVTRIYGDFLFQDYSDTMRRPVASVSGDGSRVGYMGSGVSTGVKIAAQWNVAGASLSVKTFTASSSDIRLKENIRPTEVNALSVINQMGLYQFDWKRDGYHQKIGFVADYLEQQDEHLSIGGGYDEDGNMDEKVVNDFYLMGYAIKGIQELSTMATMAETRLADVEIIARSTQSEMDSLKSQVSSLQYQLEQAYTRIATLEKQLQAAG